MSKYIYLQQESTVHLFSIISNIPPSLSLAVGEEEDRGEERSSLSLRPECLAVFKWCTTHEDLFLSAKANSLWRQVGHHTYTHPRLGHRLVCPCLCLYAGWQPSRQLRSQWVQKITMATNIVGQAVAALGSVRRLFWHPLSAGVDYKVPSLKCSSRIGQ